MRAIVSVGTGHSGSASWVVVRRPNRGNGIAALHLPYDGGVTTTADSSLSSRGRGRPPLLDLDGIVSAALEIAETEGPTAVSMSKVAQELGVAQTALYYHVHNLNDLLGIVAAEILSHVPVPDSRLRWDRWLHDFAVGLYDMIREEPILGRVPYLSVHTPLPPAVTERAMRVMTRAGFRPEIALLLFSQHIRIVVNLGYADYAAKEDAFHGRTPLGLLRDAADEVPDSEIPLLRSVLNGIADLPDDLEGFSETLFEWQLGLEMIALRGVLEGEIPAPLPRTGTRKR